MIRTASRNAASLLVTSLALLALSTGARAQAQVWVVAESPGPDVDFTTIQDAVDFAADLDLILVRPGTYAPFVVGDKALTIHGEGDVEISFVDLLQLAVPDIVVTGLSAGKSVVIRGIDASNLLLFETEPVAAVSGCAGPVVFEDCELAPTRGEGLEVFGSASVTVNRCVVAAGGTVYDDVAGVYLPSAGIRSVGSEVFVYDSVVTGSVGPAGFDPIFSPIIPPGPGGPGLDLVGGSLLATGSTITGGPGGSDDPSTPLCVDGGDGGLGLRLFAGAADPVARLLDTPVAGGAAGTSVAGCGTNDGVPGAATDVQAGTIEPLPGLARSFAWDSPVLGGDPFDVTFTGQPGDYVLLLITVGPGPGAYFRDFGVALLIDPFFLTYPIGFLPPAGTLTLTANALKPGAVEYARLSAQAAHIDTSASFFLTGPATLTILQNPSAE